PEPDVHSFPTRRSSDLPPVLLPLLARHFRNPKASSDTDATLALALKQFDERTSEKSYIFEVPYGAHFRIYNGKVFQKGAQRVKRDRKSTRLNSSHVKIS